YLRTGTPQTGLRPESLLSAQLEELPLIVQQRLGLGRVTFVALDAGLSPLKGWGGGGALWSFLLARDPSMPVPERTIGVLAQPQMQRALQEIPSLQVPTLRSLTLYLLIFVLVVGPLNYLILRRLDRREWAWLSVPALTLLFFAILFRLGIA